MAVDSSLGISPGNVAVGERQGLDSAMAALGAARLDPDIAEVAAHLTRQCEIMAAWLVDELTAGSSLRHGICRNEAIETCGS